MVVVKTEKVEQMVAIVVETGPQDVDLGLANGGRTLVFNVVRVGHNLADVVLKLVPGGQGRRDVVLDLGRGGETGHPEVRLHADGHGQDEHVVGVVVLVLGVARPGGDAESKLGDGLVQALGLGLQDNGGGYLK